MTRCAFAVSALLIASAKAQSACLVTLAGTGASGQSGDGGPASSATLYYPAGLALDGSGGYLISDRWNHAIRRVTPGGIISTVAGVIGSNGYSGDGGAATAAQLAFPQGVSTDGTGGFFIADNNNFAVRRVSSAGIISTVAGTGSQGRTGDGGPASSAQLGLITRVTLDATGVGYLISDTSNNAVRAVNATGYVNTIAGVPGSAGRTDGPLGTGRLNGPWGVALYGAGGVLIADSSNNIIRFLAPSGYLSTVAGGTTFGYSGDGGPATLAQLFYPYGIAVDSSTGAYLIADSSNNAVRRVNVSGYISTVAGGNGAGYSGDGGAATSGRMRIPNAIAMDGAGGFLVVESDNHIVRYVTPPGMCAVMVSGCSSAGGFTQCIFTSVAPYLLLNVTLAGSPCSSGTQPPATIRNVTCVNVALGVPVLLTWSTQAASGSVNVTVLAVSSTASATATSTSSSSASASASNTGSSTPSAGTSSGGASASSTASMRPSASTLSFTYVRLKVTIDAVAVSGFSSNASIAGLQTPFAILCALRAAVATSTGLNMSAIKWALDGRWTGSTNALWSPADCTNVLTPLGITSTQRMLQSSINASTYCSNASSSLAQCMAASASPLASASVASAGSQAIFTSAPLSLVIILPSAASSSAATLSASMATCSALSLGVSAAGAGPGVDPATAIMTPPLQQLRALTGTLVRVTPSSSASSYSCASSSISDLTLLDALQPVQGSPMAIPQASIVAGVVSGVCGLLLLVLCIVIVARARTRYALAYKRWLKEVATQNRTTQQPPMFLLCVGAEIASCECCSSRRRPTTAVWFSSELQTIADPSSALELHPALPATVVSNPASVTKRV